MLLAVAFVISLAVVLCVREFFAYLRFRDDQHHQERRELYARIQTPDMAPMLFPAPDPVDESVGYREEDEVLAVVRGEE